MKSIYYGHNLTLEPTDNLARKINYISTISISFRANENINAYTDILKIPKKILNIKSNVNMLLGTKTGTIRAYWHSIDNNYFSLRCRAQILANEDYSGIITCVNTPADNI
jgi:hypothetical protein